METRPLGVQNLVSRYPLLLPNPPGNEGTVRIKAGVRQKDRSLLAQQITSV
jgi:hypothetical protein